MPPKLQLIGQRFGKLVVLCFDRIKNRESFWQCQCDCGNTAVVRGHKLRTGYTKSCGCYYKETHRGILHPSFKHGAAGRGKETAEHRTWRAMLARCTNPKNQRYVNYGGRGVIVCERWQGKHGFQNFLADMGVRPSKNHSLGRFGDVGNYEPSNCTWQTRKEQGAERRTKTFTKFWQTTLK